MIYCSNCGGQIQETAKFCEHCGAARSIQPAAQPQPPAAQPVQAVQAAPAAKRGGSGFVCPQCGGTDVKVDVMEVGQMTTKKGVGFGGHVNNTARAATAVVTLGMSNLVWKKSKGTNKTKTITDTVGICQQCGCVFQVGKGKFKSAPGSIIR